MSPISIVLFTFSFIMTGILFGNIYKKFNIDYNTWLIVTIISGVVFVGEYLFERIVKKKK